MTEHHWKDQARREFDQWSAEYDKSVLQKYLFAPAHNALLDDLAADPAQRVLDIGCGTGVFARRVAGALPECTVTGLDISEGMIRVANEKMADGERMTFTVGDSEKLPFDDASFDVVTCSNSFHHYPKPDVVLGEFLRVLAPGGRAMIVDGLVDHWWGNFLFQFIIRLYEGGKVHHHSRKEFESLLGEAGFGSVTFTSVPVRWPLPMPVVLVKGLADK